MIASTNIKKVTPLRIVESIERCMAFWCDALGYEKRAEALHEGALGFVLLENAAGEIMFQTRASLAADLPSVAARNPDTVLFVEVESLSKARNAAADCTVLVRDRSTPYGKREAIVVDPQGGVVIFAEDQ